MQRILVVQVMFSLPIYFTQEKKMLALVCTQREQNKREQRKWKEGVTDSGNGHLGPEEQAGSVVKCSCTQSPLLKGPEEGPY